MKLQNWTCTVNDEMKCRLVKVNNWLISIIYSYERHRKFSNKPIKFKTLKIKFLISETVHIKRSSHLKTVKPFKIWFNIKKNTTIILHQVPKKKKHVHIRKVQYMAEHNNRSDTSTCFEAENKMVVPGQPSSPLSTWLVQAHGLVSALVGLRVQVDAELFTDGRAQRAYQLFENTALLLLAPGCRAATGGRLPSSAFVPTALGAQF